MAFKDKAKEAALQAKSSAQQIAQQGQQKLATVQKQRTEAELLRALGAAVYDEHRNTGSHDAVVSALAALDAHHSAAVVASPPSPAAEFPAEPPQTFNSMPPTSSAPTGPPPVLGDAAP
jgi:hypothetical protein